MVDSSWDVDTVSCAKRAASKDNEKPERLDIRGAVPSVRRHVVAGVDANQVYRKTYQRTCSLRLFTVIEEAPHRS